MIALVKQILNGTLVFVLLLGLGCGKVNKEQYITGDDPGEVNRANPLHEKQDETGDGFTREARDGTNGAEVGPTPGADTTNTDSTSVRVHLGE
jgi:hypothetical protein